MASESLWARGVHVRHHRQPHLSQTSINVISEFPSSVVSSSMKTSDSDDEDLKFPDETFAAADSLLVSLAPLLNFLRLFGLYFEPRSEDCVFGHKKPSAKSKKLSSSENQSLERSQDQGKVWYSRDNLYRLYSICVLALVWGNAVRFFTVFKAGQLFDAFLLWKMCGSVFNFVCAINQTSVFIACHSGQLRRILSEIPVTQQFADQLCKKAYIDTAIGCSMYLINATYYTYYICFYNGAGDILLVPFTTYIQVQSYTILVTLRAVFLIVGCFLLSSWLLPQMLNNTLRYLLSKQFNILNERFRQNIDENGRFKGDIRVFRRRHQLLCRAVRRADHFISVSNFAGFACHMACVIITLYLIIFYPLTDAISAFMIYFYMCSNGVGLMLATGNGIAVNESAHKMAKRITEIDLSLMQSREVDEVLMFQKRLFGEPIGFSVLGIFVISKTTIITVLSLMVTYFLLAVKMKNVISPEGLGCVITLNGTADQRL